ncbi:MAG: zinc ABC transporter substrate-binding protein [Hyphomicrobium sp.]|nr:zinc ABC transporter substrate-binding protein [Hyphomicrobium sp.]
MIRLPAGGHGASQAKRSRPFGPSRLLGSAVAALSLTAGSAWAEDLTVVATIKPVHALVAQVMGDAGEPKLLVGGTASPHTYSLKPSDAKALNNARLIFRVSEDIEPFTRKIVAALPKSVTVITLAGAPELTLLDKRSGNTFEAHEHGGTHDHHDHDHDDGNGDPHQGEAKGPVRDGHIWLDPRNGVAMVREITRALSEVAPDKKATFEANAAAAVASIEAAAREIDAELASVKNKPFVVFHDAYQYFEERFNVPAAGAITISPEVQPSAKRLGEIRRKIKELDVACVFAEPQFKSKLVATVVEGTGAKAGTLDPEGASIEAGPGAYVALLKNLAQSLKGCLTS